MAKAAPPARPAPADDPRWPRILARDASADGLFWYSVATTGVYCRPSCPSRAANPANVAIHDSLAAARATGFRACLRCRPDDLAPADRQADLVTRACRLLDEAEEGVPLATLAAAVGLSPAHFHRTFRAATGLTPRAFASARRAERMRAALGGGAPVTRAIHEAGFGSTSRFYERADEMLGCRLRASAPAARASCSTTAPPPPRSAWSSPQPARAVSPRS
jgi:AraC family transcriptional regulator of adaptative response/methylated-DNA-[protein]-cysteine methyltransferase